MSYYGDSHGRDIEVPCPSDIVDANSEQQISRTSLTDENPSNVTDYENDRTSGAGSQAKSISSLDISKILHFIWRILYFFICSLLGIVFVPCYVVYVFITGNASAIITGHDAFADYVYGYKQEKKEGKIHVLFVATVIRLGCLALVWLVLNLTIPNIKGVTLFGSLLWTWALLAALILMGYQILILLYSMLTVLVIGEGLVSMRFGERNVDFCIEGLSRSIMLIMYFTSILVTWILCIDTKNPYFHRYGALTLVSFLVGAILNLARSIVLLLWKTKLIYSRYEHKILLAGCQLYFYYFIMDERFSDRYELVPWRKRKSYKPQTIVGVRDDYNRQKNLPTDDYMLKIGASLKHIDMVATYLTRNFESTLTGDNNNPDIVLNLRQKFSSDDRSNFNILTTTARDKPGVDISVPQLLLEVLQAETSITSPTYEDFEKWMVVGYERYRLVGLKLKGAAERMNNLDRVLTCSIVVLVILVWLFITGWATTNVVVALASLFLGISFVFADACKAFFLGLTFTFVVHPYDVGDQCIINDTELLVKKVNILSTVFENQHKNTVIYPNLDLANKNIVKLDNEPVWYLKSEPSIADLEDLIELHLHSSTNMSRIRELQQHIDKCLQDGIKCGQFSSSYDITVEEDGQNAKMSIHFKHKLIDGDVSMKRKQRSKLFLGIKQFMEDTASANEGIEMANTHDA